MADFVELVAMNTISATSWGAVYGGYAFDTSVELNGSIAYYWSATARDRTYAYSLDINSGGFFAPRNYDSKCLGYQVRCVK
jgi:uncharacterized protein (TIGR02145 family)